MSKNHQYVPIAKRTRFQWYKYCENQSRVSRQTTREVIDADEYEIKKTAAPKTDHDNEAGPSTSKVRVKKSDSLDDSDSEEKHEGADESQNNTKTYSLQSTEDDEDDSLSSSESKSEYEPLSSSESESEDEQLSSSDSESDNSEDSNFLPQKRKKSPLENTKKKARSESVERNKKKTASKTSTQDVFEGPCRPTKRRCDEARKVDKVFVDESEEETNHYNAEESDGVEELDISEFEKAVMETEEADGSESNMKANTLNSPEDDEDESSSSSESEDEDEPPVKRKLSPMENTKKKVRSGSADRKEDDPLVCKTRMKRMDKRPMDELCDIGIHERKKARNVVKDRYLKADKANAVKNQEPKEKVLPKSVDRKEHDHSVQEMEKMDRKTMGESSGFDRYTTVDKSSSDEESNRGSPKDDGGSVDAILDSVIGSEGVQGKKSVGSYKFRFDDSADESMSQNNGESEAEGLFEEMHFTLECEEIGSYRPPTVEKQEKDDNISHIDLCRRGEHGEVYLEEQTGLRCCLCGAVVLEIKDAISKLAKYTPDKSKRRYQFDEQQIHGHENQYVEDSNWNQLDICNKVKGTAWELIAANGSQSNNKADTFQSPEDDEDGPSSSSESDEPPVKREQSPMEKTKEKVRSGSADRKEDDPLVHKTRMKKMDKKPMDELSNVGVHEIKKARNIVKDRYMKADKANAVKNQELKERVLPESVDIKEHDRYTMGESSGFDRYTRVDKSSSDEESNTGSPKDDGSSLDAILDSVIGNEGVQGKKSVSSYKFRFDDSEDESMSQKTDEFGAEGLFEDMDFALECEEIGSYRAPTVEKQEKDDNISHIDLCRRGEHGELYLEEQTGLRCCLCGAVVLEIKDAISKLANYTPAMSKRRYQFDEQQFDGHENEYVEDSNWNRLDISKKVKGTVWELIPARVRAHLYPHQQEGFKFLWENLAGTIKLSGLQKLGPRGGGGGGGCIISHAPGTGKSLLTIVFVEIFLKIFPRCCPVIVAPASMLLTWEAEFKKWQVGFSFINLSSSDFLRKERIKGSSRHNKDRIRAIKLRSWSNGGSVLGMSYNLYTKLAGNSNTKNKILEKMRNVLLDMPGLVVLDEGHTPRNQNSNIWNTLLKLKTKNRVILSGTPFQNNFRELFNTLRLVRPETANNIVNEKIFADIIQQNMKRSRSRSTYEDIKKLKLIISPFVHVHEGHILESKLPGLKESVILLEPPPLQKGLIQNLGNMANFEYEHKVALVSVHPSLILYCSFSEKEEKSVNKQQLEKVRLQPDYGVKTRFVMELIRLGVSLHEKVLIFSQYIQPLELLKDQIAQAFGWAVGREMLLIEGKIQQKHRQTIINDFNDPDSKVKVLLASTKCCSEGIHLVGASRVVLLDIVWNPAVERQAISRAYRLGQKKVVYTYHLMTAGTTEEEKYDRQVEKGRLAELVFSKSGEEPKKKQKVVELNDKILQQMVDHQQLKDMFKKIRYPENVKG